MIGIGSVRNIFKIDLVRHNITFFIGTLLISLFNYVYYPVLSRMVSVVEFGEIQAIMSIFTQIAVFVTAYGYAVTHIVANAHSEESAQKNVLELERFMLFAACFLFLLLAVYTIMVGGQANLDPWSVLAIGLLVLLNVPLTSLQYALQGKKDVKAVSVGGVIFALGKLILTVVLIYLMTNNILASIMSYIIALLIALCYFRFKLPDYDVVTSLVNNFSFRLSDAVRKELKYIGFITIVLFCVTALYISDTVLARIYFDEQIQGLYSGISSVGRIVFFVTASISGVMLTHIKLRYTAQKNLKTLVYSLALVLLIGGTIAAFFAIFPSYTIRLLMSSDFIVAAEWLPQVALMMLMAAIVNTLAVYQIALREYRSTVPLASALLALIIGTAIAHHNIEIFVSVYILVSFVLSVILSVQIIMRSYNVEKRPSFRSTS